jgi:hypothetical protein
VPGQVQLLDDQRVQQRDDVRARADQVALVGEGPLQRRGPAELRAPLQHQHRPSGAGEVGRRGQPVVPAADDDGVPAPGGELGDRGGQADAAQDVVHAGHGGRRYRSVGAAERSCWRGGHNGGASARAALVTLAQPSRRLCRGHDRCASTRAAVAHHPAPAG